MMGQPVNGPREEVAASGNAAAAVETPPLEETLDPEDWHAFRDLAHEMLDRVIDLQRDVRGTPAWRPIPEAIERRFTEPVPLRGAGDRGAYDAFLEMVLPYPTGLHHPRWLGWAGGTGSPMGMMAALLGAGMNAVPGNFNDAASRVEAQLLDWMKALMGFPASASGLVASGGSEANILGLAVGRDARLGSELDTGGVRAVAGTPRLYASSEVHSSVVKGVKLLGLGRGALRLVGVDQAFRVRVDEMRAMIERDIAAGDKPFLIIGSAGTINTGAVDDLHGLADLAGAYGLWFHVDGAFGAMAALSPETRGLVDGLQRADSLAFDFHKWMYVNYEAGCVLLRDADAHRRTFAAGGEYLRPLPRGVGARADTAGGRGIQLSRGFKALKPWMMLRQHGAEKFGRLVAQNVRQARYFASRVDASRLLTRVAPVELNVVAWRHADPALEGEQQDEVNRELLMRIQERGIAIPSTTIIDGRLTLRVCICNHRSRRADFDDLIDAAEGIVREIRAESR